MGSLSRTERNRKERATVCPESARNLKQRATLPALAIIAPGERLRRALRTGPRPLQKARNHANRIAALLKEWVVPPSIRVSSSHIVTIPPRCTRRQPRPRLTNTHVPR